MSRSGDCAPWKRIVVVSLIHTKNIIIYYVRLSGQWIYRMNVVVRCLAVRGTKLVAQETEYIVLPHNRVGLTAWNMNGARDTIYVFYSTYFKFSSLERIT